MRFLRRRARKLADTVSDKAAGWSRPGQQYRVRPNRESWREHNARVEAMVRRAQQRVLP